MHFLAPLSFLFALTIPVVVVFYLLKRKRVVRLVSSTLLWQKFLAETQASAPFQKLRRNWLLILQILLLLLAVLALTRPYFATQGEEQRFARAHPGRLGLDARHGRNALRALKKRARRRFEWVDSLRDRRQDGGAPGRRQHRGEAIRDGDKTAFRRAIMSCRAVDSPTHLIPALKMAESLVRDRGKESNPEIHLFSDGAVPDRTCSTTKPCH